MWRSRTRQPGVSRAVALEEALRVGEGLAARWRGASSARRAARGSSCRRRPRRRSAGRSALTARSRSGSARRASTRATSSCVEKGFTMYSSAPAARARATSSIEPLAVSISTRVSRRARCARMARQISSPLRTGSIRSRSARCGWNSSSASIARAPSRTVRVACPSFFMRNSSSTEMLSSSSAMKMRLDAMRCGPSGAHEEPRRGQATVAGSVKVKTEPRPGSLSTHRRPPKWSTIWRQIASPSPVPGGLLGERVADLAELLEDDAPGARGRCPRRCPARRRARRPASSASRHLDPARALGRELHRVGQQVQHHLHDAVAVGDAPSGTGAGDARLDATRRGS